MGCTREEARWGWPAEGRQCQRRQSCYGPICSVRRDGSHCYMVSEGEDQHLKRRKGSDSPFRGQASPALRCSQRAEGAEEKKTIVSSVTLPGAGRELQYVFSRICIFTLYIFSLYIFLHTVNGGVVFPSLLLYLF